MGEVIALVARTFRPERWVADWEALGCSLHLSDGAMGKDGAFGVLLLDWAPIHARNDHPRRIARLRGQIAQDSAERAAVIDFLQRRAATRGWR